MPVVVSCQQGWVTCSGSAGVGCQLGSVVYRGGLPVMVSCQQGWVVSGGQLSAVVSWQWWSLLFSTLVSGAAAGVQVAVSLPPAAVAWHDGEGAGLGQPQLPPPDLHRSAG